MKQLMLATYILFGATLAFANTTLIATSDIKIEANKTSVKLVPLMSEGNTLCWLSFQSESFDRIITKNASFEVLGIDRLPKHKASVEELNEFLYAYFGLRTSPDSMTPEQVIAFAKKNYGIKIDPEFYLTNVQLKSLATGNDMAITCQSSVPQIALPILGFLSKNSPLVPRSEM